MMKTLYSLILFIIFATIFFFIQKKPALPPNERFWAHHFQIRAEIPYGKEDPRQHLDVYQQGQWSGEPNYFTVNESPRPTVIQIHGGGWISGDKIDVANWLTHYVKKGWNVVNLNYRIGNNSAPAAIDDVMCAVKWIVENAKAYYFDSNKLVMTGFSSGGTLALLAAMLNRAPGLHECYVGEQLKIRAVINWFGITDIERLESFLATNNRPNYPLRWIGDKTNIKAFSQRFSPIHNVTANTRATLTIHGDKDTIVPYDQATALHHALEKNGVKNQLLTLQGGTHGGFTESQYQDAFKGIFKFLDEVGVE